MLPTFTAKNHIGLPLIANPPNNNPNLVWFQKRKYNKYHSRKQYHRQYENKTWKKTLRSKDINQKHRYQSKIL